MKILTIPTSQKEIFDILKAWLAISLAFAILLNNGISPNAKFLGFMLVSAFTVGTGFLFHELSHKLVAQRYGCRAEFRSFDAMLVFAIAMSFFGFVFAAPGAVFIAGKVTKKRNAIISAAGPITNIAIALVFLALLLALPGSSIASAFSYGFMINSWLALFNLIPFFNFDGVKVLAGNKVLYAVLLAASLGLMGLQYMLQ